MSKQSGNRASPIRRISKDEQDSRRRWPDKKQLASSQNIPLPKPGQKNRIHSVLIALPALMLMIGLFVHFRGESAQINGEPVLAELTKRDAQFKSVSEVSGIGKSKFYLWYTLAGSARGVRISEVQKEKLSELEPGDAISLELVPRVAGSKTMWAYRISQGGTELIGPAVNAE